MTEIVPIEWEEAFKKVPNKDREPFQKMRFVLHDSQVDVVKAALKRAKMDGETYCQTHENKNSNGNALAFICLQYGKSEST